MSKFIPGRTLCRGFFFDEAQPILAECFPDLAYSAGLIGYGSDVLGYDDEMSADHMWGPRFYLFLRRADLSKRDALLDAFGTRLPYTYKGYSVHFTAPDESDNGVRHPSLITEGRVEPLIFITAWEDYLIQQLGTADPALLTAAGWLALSEHRLLSLAAGEFYRDDLGCAADVAKLHYYPDEVRLYLIASQWDILASEQAFVGRCVGRGDEIGARILTARMCERLMRLCFLYRGQYAPYPKWFGTAFAHLDVPAQVKREIDAALSAGDSAEGETHLIEAQLAVAAMHNESGLTPPVECRAQSYYGRPIRVIFADRFSAAAARMLRGTALADVPLIGSFSQMGGLSEFSDDPARFTQIAQFYK